MRFDGARCLTLAFALTLLAVRPIVAQAPVRERLPEPLLRETPWGDFPLERLLPGARLRFTWADGHRVERRVLALADSTLELRSEAGDSTLRLGFAALRGYQRIEVRAIPKWANRVGTGSVIVGALLGAASGAIIHNARKPSSAAVRRRGLADDMVGAATVGGLVGWEIGIHTLGMPRWRPVTLP